MSGTSLSSARIAFPITPSAENSEVHDFHALYIPDVSNVAIKMFDEELGPARVDRSDPASLSKAAAVVFENVPVGILWIRGGQVVQGITTTTGQIVGLRF